MPRSSTRPSTSTALAWSTRRGKRWKQVAEVANRPIVADIETQVGQGAAGGFVFLSQRTGEDAADLITRILSAEGASGVPVAASDAVRPAFDWRELQRWNV